ncbi:MAG: hypothetical protein IIA44_02040, partial [Acidobacteria bacterium]|nr:hypothetical protein [Acidobacteriota bacterium]
MPVASVVDVESSGPVVGVVVSGGTVVVDRGMAAIKARGCHYVAAARQSERGPWEEDFMGGEWQEIQHKGPPGSGKQRVWFQVREAGGEVH